MSTVEKLKVVELVESERLEINGGKEGDAAGLIGTITGAVVGFFKGAAKYMKTNVTAEMSDTLMNCI